MADAAFVPQWNGAIENYARKYVARNSWRLRWLMSEEDCLGEAGAVFARCHKLYAERVDTPQWFMRLFQIALVNEFNTLSVKCRRQREAEGIHAHEAHHGTANIDHNLGTLGVSLSEASDELGEVLAVIANAPARMLRLLLTEGDEASWSRRLSRLCGLDIVREDIIAELRELLSDPDDLTDVLVAAVKQASWDIDTGIELRRAHR